MSPRRHAQLGRAQQAFEAKVVPFDDLALDVHAEAGAAVVLGVAALVERTVGRRPFLFVSLLTFTYLDG